MSRGWSFPFPAAPTARRTQLRALPRSPVNAVATPPPVPIPARPLHRRCAVACGRRVVRSVDRHDPDHRTASWPWPPTRHRLVTPLLLLHPRRRPRSAQPFHRSLAGHQLGGSTSIPASNRCSAVIGVGAPVSGSCPPPVLGNAMTSRSESASASSMQMRSQPKAMPPWGGGP